MVWSLVVLMGRSVRATGMGKDSMRVIFSMGSVERTAGGMSAGEQARMRWRRWVFEVYNDMFSVGL